MANPSAADARRWLRRFAALDAVQRRQSDPAMTPADSIRLSLSLISAIYDAAGSTTPHDPLRGRDEELGRAAWAQLRHASGIHP